MPQIGFWLDTKAYLNVQDIRIIYNGRYRKEEFQEIL